MFAHLNVKFHLFQRKLAPCQRCRADWQSESIGIQVRAILIKIKGSQEYQGVPWGRTNIDRNRPRGSPTESKTVRGSEPKVLRAPRGIY